MSGTIPKAYHDAGRARREHPDPSQRAAPRHALTPCPLPTTSTDRGGALTEEYKLTDANMIRVMETIEACQKHTTHVLSCRKGVIGKIHCRFSCPRGRHVDPTGPLEIEALQVQVGSKKPVVEARLRGAHGTVTRPPHFKAGNSRENHLVLSRQGVESELDHCIPDSIVERALWDALDFYFLPNLFSCST